MRNKIYTHLIWSVPQILLLVCCMFVLPVVADQPSPAQGYRQFNLLAINDIYNIEGIDARRSGSFARFRTLRQQMSLPDQPVLVLHAGDFLFPSSMSSQFNAAQMIDIMNLLDGTAQGFDPSLFVVFGNHEFDKSKMKHGQLLAKRIEGSDFYWLGTNVKLNQAAQLPSQRFKQSLITNHILEINQVKVGIYGLTTDILVPEYASIDSDLLAISQRNIADLRARGAEVILAVTHLQMSEDIELLEQLGDNGPDGVFGGHEHNRQTACVGKRCVVKADADLRSAAVVNVQVAPNGEVAVSHYFAMIDDTTVASDPQVLAKTDHWLQRYQTEYCQKQQLDSGCLQKVLGKTAVDLIAEELEIRRFETNLGSYVADQMIRAFDEISLPQGRTVQAALINSGSLRLNQNIPAGTELTQWYLNGLFQYPVDLRVLEITGKDLKQMIHHAVTDWTGNGWWLQVSGIAYRHDSIHNRASEISLLDKQGKATLVKDDDRIVVVVNDYMADGSRSNQDGYTMLNLNQNVPYGELISLKDVVTQSIVAAAEQGGIAPRLSGRICNNRRPQLFCILD